MRAVEIVFVADDFGWSAETNAAIVRAHTHGVLTGASLMLGQPATEDAVRLARKHPMLQIGWHLHLCNSQPLTCAAWPWGSSFKKAGWAIGYSAKARKLMRAEIHAQWEAYRATGLPCAFVNVHHHLHAHPAVWHTLRATLPVSFKGWIRHGTPMRMTAARQSRLLGLWSTRRRRACRWTSSDTLWGADRIFRMQTAEVRAVMAGLGPGLHEFMFHPRRLEADGDLQTLIELKTK